MKLKGNFIYENIEELTKAEERRRFCHSGK